MTRPDGLGCLSDEQWADLQIQVSLYEQAWQQAGPQGTVELEGFLLPPGHSLRLAYVHEFIKTDLEIQWRRGKVTLLDDYVRRFRELRSPRELPAQLIYEEYRVRHLYGDRPDPDAYRSRFPDQFSELQQLLRRGSVRATPAASRPAPVAASVSDAVLGVGSDVGRGHILKKYLGHGQFAQVWEATAPGDVPCAIKVLSWTIDQAQSQTERNALELTKRLSNPYLLRPRAFWELGDRLVIVMDLAEGSLGDRLKACLKQGLPGIPARELLRYIKDAAEGLDSLHASGLIHRDVKPANLLYSHGHALVADCGLARYQPDSICSQGSVAGTLAYMAPEAMQGRAKKESDLFGLAVTYAELRCGHQLQSSAGDGLWLSMVKEDPDLSEFGQGERRVIKKALHHNYKLRHKSCTEFALALEKALELQPSLPRFVLWVMGLFWMNRRRSAVESDRSTFTDNEQTRYSPEVPGSSAERPVPGPMSSGGDAFVSIKAGSAASAPPSPAAPVVLAETRTPPPMRSDRASAALPPPHGGAAEAVRVAESMGGLAGTIIPGMTPPELPAVAPAASPGTVSEPLAAQTLVSAPTKTFPPRRVKRVRATRLVTAVLLLAVIVAAAGMGGFVLKGFMRSPGTDPEVAERRDTPPSDTHRAEDGGPGAKDTPKTPVTPPTIPDSRSLAKPDNRAKQSQQPQWAGFENYRRARDLENTNSQGAADAMVLALSAGGLEKAAVSAPTWRADALQVLAKAAQQLRATAPLAPPFRTPADAKQAQRWLTEANKLIGISPADDAELRIRAGLAMAEWQVAGSLSAEMYQQTEALIKQGGDVKTLGDHLGPDAVPFLLMVAESHRERQSGESDTAITTYAEIYRRLTVGQQRASEEELYAKVLQPARGLSVPPEASKEVKQQAAKLHAALGRLLDHRVMPAWVKEKNPQQTVIDAFGAAIELDRTEPRYYIARGYALAKRDKLDWDAAEQDARSAAQVAGKEYPDGFALLGHVALLRARIEVDVKKHEVLLRSSVSAYEQAIGLLAHDDLSGRLNSDLTERSTAYVELANFVKGPAARKRYLDLGMADADRVLQDRNASKLDTAYALWAKGNALEDYAWLLGESKARNYEAACQQFKEAGVTLDLPSLLMQEGRCLCKWAMSCAEQEQTDASREKAKEAIAHLLSARGNLDNAEKAQALHWLGKASLLLSDYDGADAYLKEATESAIKDALPGRSMYQLTWAEVALRRAAEAVDKLGHAAIKDWVQKARDRCENVSDDWRLEVARIKGQSYQYGRDYQKALDVYSEALPDDPTKAHEEAYIPLLIGFAVCRLELNEMDGKRLEEARRSAEQAIRLLNESSQHADRTRADAYAAAAKTHGRLARVAPAAQGVNTAHEHRKAAVEMYQSAAKKAPSHPFRWSWEEEIGINCLWLLGDERAANDRADYYEYYYKCGKDHLDQAKQLAPMKEQATIDRAMEGLELKRPKG
jgi:serine/threonine protein kinase/tetratricopeptide (TPR) repeat protein